MVLFCGIILTINIIMGLYINGQKLEKPYINGKKYNAYLNGVRIWQPPIKRFVAISDAASTNSSGIAYTDDGINWLGVSVPDNLSLYDIVFCNNKFYILAGAHFLSSKNGINWTKTSLPSSTTWTMMAYGNGKFVIFSMNNDNKSAYSTDGINWTTKTLPVSESSKNIRFFDERFIFYSYNYSYNIRNCFKSADGINWNSTQVSQDYSRAKVCNNKLYIGISDILQYSYNGIDWYSDTVSGISYYSIMAYGNNKYVILSPYNGTSVYSSDFTNWTKIILPYNSEWVDTVFGNEKFVSISRNESNTGTTASNKACYSTIGSQWMGSILPSNKYWTKLAYGEVV
jgi:hypothetical protein